MAAQFSQTMRALGKDTGHRSLWIWLLATVVLTGWICWFLFVPIVVYENSSRARLEVEKAPHGVDALLASRVASSSLAMGQLVQEGDVLVVLDSSRVRIQLQEEEARHDYMAATITHLRRVIEARQQSTIADREAAVAATEVALQRTAEAHAALELAENTRTRVSELTARGHLAKIELPKAEAEAKQLAASQNAWRSEARKIDREAKSKQHASQAEIEELMQSLATMEGSYAASEAAITLLNNEIERHLIRAPISGRVGDVLPLRAGTYVGEGQRLATVVPSGALILLADFIPRIAMGRIRPGQHARLRLDGFPWTQYGAITATVANVASEIRDGYVRVEFQLDDIPNTGIPMQHGLPGAVEVAIEQTSPALLLLHSVGVLLAERAPKVTIVSEARR